MQSGESQQKGAGSQLWGTGSVIGGSGSRTRGAGSEIRWGPPQQRAAGLLLWARQAGDIDRLDERRSAVTASGVTLSADVGS